MRHEAFKEYIGGTIHNGKLFNSYTTYTPLLFLTVPQSSYLEEPVRHHPPPTPSGRHEAWTPKRAEIITVLSSPTDKGRRSHLGPRQSEGKAQAESAEGGKNENVCSVFTLGQRGIDSSARLEISVATLSNSDEGRIL